jgi:hypothetical protein
MTERHQRAAAAKRPEQRAEAAMEVAMAEVVGSEVDYRRTQRIVHGTSCCDFRYRIRFRE